MGMCSKATCLTNDLFAIFYSSSLLQHVDLSLTPDWRHYIHWIHHWTFWIPWFPMRKGTGNWEQYVAMIKDYSLGRSSFSNLLTFPKCRFFQVASLFTFGISHRIMFLELMGYINDWINFTCQRGSFWSGNSSKYLWASCTGGRVWSRRLVQLFTKLARLTNVYNPSRSFP